MICQIPTFYALIFSTVYPTNPVEAIAAAAVYSALLVVMLILWLWLELTNPAAPGGCACPCFKEDRFWNSKACEWQPNGRNGRIAPDFEIKPSTKKTNQLVVRYDAATKKRVKGLDHFCKWLNTPVGFRNYPHFFVLVVLCNVQVCWCQDEMTIATNALAAALRLPPCAYDHASRLLLAQVVYTLAVSIAALAAWGASAYIWAWVLWILNAVGCCVLIYFGFELLFYHVYLMRRGISTYDDIFEKAQKRTLARKQAAKQKAGVKAASVRTNADASEPSAR